MKARPFLKWVGGKAQLLPELLSVFKSRWHFGARYFEPFLGGGAVLFASEFRPAVVNDINSELIDAYRAVSWSPEKLIKELSSYPYNKEFYLKLRDCEPRERICRAARMIYLNKCSFNGLYRVNKAGKFNVPFGKYAKAPNYCDAENIRACSKALSSVEIVYGDFQAVAEQARCGDLVYFDPPYIPVSSTSSFTAYSSGGFGLEEQKRLALCFRGLARRGVEAVLSNSASPLVRELYEGFPIREVKARRNVSCKGRGRGEVSELIITSWRR